MNTTEARTNGAWKLGSLIAVLVLAMAVVLGNASTAFATHTTKLDESKGKPYSITLHISDAGNSYTWYDTGGMLMDHRDGTQCRSRTVFIKNDTKYRVFASCYGFASDTKTHVQWLIGIHGNTGIDVVGNGTKRTDLITGTYMSPGDEIQVDAVNMSTRDVTSTKVLVQIGYRYGGEIDKLQTMKPIVSATKLASDRVEVCVRYPDGSKADVSGVSKIILYQGSKKVKSWTTNAQIPVRKYIAKGSKAVKASYKVVSTTIDNESDTITSDAVKPQANSVVVTKKKPKLKDFEFCTFVPSKLSYSGKKLIVEGYTVNPEGFKMTFPMTVEVSVPGKQIAYYQDWQHSWGKGVKKVKVSIAAKKVVNLRAGNVVCNNIGVNV